ncbi:hypothetical protein Bca52824_050043 [Brassica carinata]|uniref:Uncharacterized protein n=1 Tax=Brassica carinata TaxID=52824 RepID=A0A8X7RRK7_BRACI|nr:hypothetical protein Bca52824_050043 [Brassica carinata]
MPGGYFSYLKGFAFLYNNIRICSNSQEALCNVARAYHHVGLVTHAASYYDKVLAIYEKEYPMPKLPNEDPNVAEERKPVSCDLRKEAAHNLHLIYKHSGAFDLARQVLKITALSEFRLSCKLCNQLLLLLS